LGGVPGDRLGIDGISMVANVALLRARPLLSDFAFQLERRLMADHGSGTTRRKVRNHEDDAAGRATLSERSQVAKESGG